MTLDRIDPRLLDLVPSLGRLVPPAVVIDKHVYSPFVERRLLQVLRQRQADTLVITGAETDVCVLAAVLGAVDFGYRVVLATDALCSSSDTTHEALLTLPGSWQRYFHHWEEMTLDRIDPRLLDFVPSLVRLAPPTLRT